MKLPTIFIPEITRDVETDMLVVGTPLRAIGDAFTLPRPQLKQQPVVTLKSPTPTTPKLSRAQIRTLITPCSPPSSLPKTLLPKVITPISPSRFLIKGSYRHKYTPSTPSSLRTSTISAPTKPSKPSHLSSPSRSSSTTATNSRSSSPNNAHHHHQHLLVQKRHRILFSHLAPQLLKSLITAKIQDEILERRRACEARERDAWERHVLGEADDREMGIGRGRLRMMSVWLDLRCLVSQGSGFVFEGSEGGEERDERLAVEDDGDDVDLWSREVIGLDGSEEDWRDALEVEGVEDADSW